MEETKTRELRLEAIKTTIKYKEKARKSKKKLVIECIKDVELEKTEKR